VLAAKIDGADAQSLRDAADQYKSKLGDAVVVLGAQVADDKVSLVSSVAAAVSRKVSAGALIGEVAKLVGGKGGGRPDFAQAGGNDPSRLEEALRKVPELVAAKLGGT
jgi:alanyl-tRNA synthetase